MQMLFRCVHFNCLVGLALISLSQLFNKFILQSVRFSHALNYEQEKNIIYFPLYILFFHMWVGTNGLSFKTDYCIDSGVSINFFLYKNPNRHPLKCFV